MTERTFTAQDVCTELAKARDRWLKELGNPVKFKPERLFLMLLVMIMQEHFKALGNLTGELWKEESE